MGVGERIGVVDDQDCDLPGHLVDDLDLLCPATGLPCAVKFGLRRDYEAGDLSSPAVRERAATLLSIALTLHEDDFLAGGRNCQPGQSCPIPPVPFELAAQPASSLGIVPMLLE